MNGYGFPDGRINRGTCDPGGYPAQVTATMAAAAAAAAASEQGRAAAMRATVAPGHSLRPGPSQWLAAPGPTVTVTVTHHGTGIITLHHVIMSS